MKSNNYIDMMMTDKVGTKMISRYSVLILWLCVTIFMPRSFVNAQETSSSLPTKTSQIDLQDLTPLLKDRLIQEGVEEGVKLAFSNPTKTIPADYSFLNLNDIKQVTYSKSSGRFVIRLPALNNAPSYIVTGYARTPVTFPVLINNVKRGDIIDQGNIEWIESDGKPPRNYIENADNIIGMVARRPLNANNALRETDLQKPILIKKGAIITMLYETAGMTLSHRGLAETNGGLGDVITVKNPNTDKIIKAVIIAPGKVQILGSTS